jgi:hypothetical protein
MNLIPFPLSHTFIFLLSPLSFLFGKDGIFTVFQTSASQDEMDLLSDEK